MIPLSKFSVHSDKCLTAEASSLGYKAGQVPGERLYEDACDFGIRIVSDRTGQVYSFLLEETLEDGSWVYRPIDKKCPCPRAVIWND